MLILPLNRLPPPSPLTVVHTACSLVVTLLDLTAGVTAGNALMWTTNETEPVNKGGGGGQQQQQQQQQQQHTRVDVPKTKFGRPGQVVRRLAWGTHAVCKDWVAVTVDDTLEVVHV